MSTTIDNRVVEMRFDNKQFESNVQTSLNTLDKLKQSLNLSGAAKGLEEIDSASKRVNMSGLGSAVEAVQAKFSALQVMAVTALANITNSAVNTGKRMVSALTIDPIKTGFNEYETKINSIQTIMSNTASKGTTMEDVTKVIGELNTYADKTIYNFAEMTRNIGTFTAAGIGLEDSAAAIQGIANLAAASGSSSQQASTAMYQLSQALSTGTVRLMDWNSVVNAGMGGEKFQEALKATAREYGVDVDSIIEKNGSFRDSLQEGWLSADILNKTLQKFTTGGAQEYAKSMIESGKWTQAEADALLKEAQAMEDAATKVKTFTQLWDTLKESAQSGWSQTWEIIVGDFEEAKETLTKFSDVIGGMIGASADARNNLLQGWKDAGGRADLIDSLFNVFEGIMSVVKPIKEAFREIFPPMTVDQLVKFTEGLKNLTEKFKLSETTSNNLKRTFAGLFAVLDIIKQAFSAVVKAVSSLFGIFGDLGGGVLGVTANFGDFLVGLRDAIVRCDIFNKVLGGLVTVIKFVANGIKNLVTGFKNIFSAVGDAASSVGSGISNAIRSAGASIENWSIVKILQSVWNGVKSIASGIAKALNTIKESFGGAFSVDGFQNLLNIINSIIAGGVGVGLIKFINALKDSFGGASDIIEGITDIFGGLGGVLEAYQTQLKAGSLIKIAAAIAILVGSIVVLSFIDSEKLYDGIVAIAALFASLVGTMALINKTTGSIVGVQKISAMMLAMSASVLILAIALKKVADLEFDKLATGLLGIAGLMAIMVASVKILGSGGKKVLKGATQMLIFAASIKVLASACKDLAALDWGELARGLVGVGVLMAEVSIFMRTAKFSGKSITTATGMVILASAIKILASACADFGQMNWGDIGKGLVSIGALLLELAIFTKLTGNAKHVISTGIALIAIAGAMKILASSMHDIAALSWGDIAKGLVAIAGALLAVAIATKLMPKNLIGLGAGLVVVSSALLIMASALKQMGSMSWESVAKGLLTLGGSLVILAIGLHAMKGTTSGSAAMLVASVSLAIMAPVLKSLGNMSWGAIAKGLVTIAGAFAVIGIAGLLLKPILPAILGLAGALALVGIGVAAFGVGIAAAGAGLTALAAGFVAIGGSIAVVATGIVAMISSVITGFIEGIGAGIIAFCKVISEGAPALGEAVKAVVLSVCDVLIECVPVIATTLLELVSGLLDALVKFTPRIVDSLFKFLLAILEGLARNIPQLIQGIVDVFMSIFSGVVDALGSIDINTLLKGIAGIGMMAGVMAALSAVSTMIPGAMVGVLGMGVVIAELALVLAAIGALGQIPGLNWLINEGGTVLQGIGNAIGSFIGGIVGGFMGGISSRFPQIGADLSAFMINIQPFVDGARKIDATTMAGVDALANVIMKLTAANILEGLASWFTGGSSLASFGEELAEFGPHFKEYYESIKGVDGSVVKASASAATALAEMASKLPNQGGIISWFTGDNSLAVFAEELAVFGPAMKEYADSVKGLDAEAVEASANAAKALSDLASNLPNQGGIISWFTGDNTLSMFAEELEAFGPAMKKYSDSVRGIDSEAVTASANAAMSLSDLANNLPNQGGIVSWFTGDNTLSMFAEELESFGPAMKKYADSVRGIDSEAVVASANAAMSLADLVKTLPDKGGIVSWFTGDQNLSDFAKDLAEFGPSMKIYADSVRGIDADSVMASANAAMSLAEVAKNLPERGGIGEWFAGSEMTLTEFAEELASFGTAMKQYSDSIRGIDAEAVLASANAAKSLSEVAANLPERGGIGEWFAGSEMTLSDFAAELAIFGPTIKQYADSVRGIDVEAVMASANAAKTLSEVAKNLPERGGMGEWFGGSEMTLTDFAAELAVFGPKIKQYSDSVKGIDVDAVTSSANAAKILSEVAANLPNQGGIVEWFTGGEMTLSDFGAELAKFAPNLKTYSNSVKGIDAESVTASANAAKALSEVVKNLPEQGGIKEWFTGGEMTLSEFAEELVKFGPHMKKYSASVTGLDGDACINSAKTAKELVTVLNSMSDTKPINLVTFGECLPSLGAGLSKYNTYLLGMNPAKITSTIDVVERLADMMKALGGTESANAAGFVKSLDELGKAGVDKFVAAFDEAEQKIKTAGQGMVDKLAKGVESKINTISSFFSRVLNECISAIRATYQSFYSAGSYVVSGFAAGISANSYMAAAQARSMALSAKIAAEKALGIKSPSREFYAIGNYAGLGFVNALDDFASQSYKAGVGIADSAKDGLNSAIRKITNVIESDMDTQPMIRPVLDLSDVESGVGYIDNLLGIGSTVGVSANVGAIKSMMSQRNQNGANGDVVLAIDKLRKELGNVGNTSYNINGVTYDDGSNIAEAVQAIVRAAKIERRM